MGCIGTCIDDPTLYEHLEGSVSFCAAVDDHDWDHRRVDRGNGSIRADEYGSDHNNSCETTSNTEEYALDLYFDYQHKQAHIAKRIYHPQGINSIHRIKSEIIIEDSNGNINKIKYPAISHAKYIQEKLSTFIGVTCDEEIEAHEHIHCENITDCSIERCDSVNMLIDEMLYYDSLNLTDKVHQDEFIKSVEAKTTVLLNHWTHFILYHKEDLKYIYSLYASEQTCDVAQCIYSQRHHRDRTQDPITHDDAYICIYRDLLDNIHCYLNHLWHYGYRPGKNEGYVEDMGFYKCGNKYHIPCVEDDVKVTFMDHFTDFLVKALINEEYDTDAVQIDVMTCNPSKESNIFAMVRKGSEYTQIHRHLHELNGMYFFSIANNCK